VSQDQEFLVRQNLAIQLASLSEFCHELGTEGAYNTMVKLLLPVFRRLVADDVVDVREAASISLIQVASFVKMDDQMEHVLTIVLELAHQSEKEDLRITAAGLMNGLAPVFGWELCQQFVVPEIISLSQDSHFKVRKAVALSLDKLLKVADRCRDRLLPAFLRLSKDPVWGVRKSCADSLAFISESVNQETRVRDLLPLLEVFREDPIKWVRGALSQRLGQFIASLPSEVVTKEIVGLFTDMIDINSSMCWINRGQEGSSHGQTFPPQDKPKLAPEGVLMKGDYAPNDFANNIVYCCAYNFPAVALKIGPERWDELSVTFSRLAQCENILVRRVMSHSLHELARIVGPAVAEADLLPCLRKFLNDSHEVRIGVVQSISEFLRVLPDAKREMHLQILKEIIDDAYTDTPVPSSLAASSAPFSFPDRIPSPPFLTEGLTVLSASSKWRFRLAFAKQLPMLCNIFSQQSVVSSLAPLGSKLMRDDVFEVRKAAQCMVGHCLVKLRSSDRKSNTMHISYRDAVIEMSKARSFGERQQYIDICLNLQMNPSLSSEFEKPLLDAFLELARDRVPNVRLAFAKALRKMMEVDSFREKVPSCNQLLETLENDSDRDVVDAARTR